MSYLVTVTKTIYFIHLFIQYNRRYVRFIGGILKLFHHTYIIITGNKKALSFFGFYYRLVAIDFLEMQIFELYNKRRY
ncbi:hypothetical protein H4683_002682 [Filibacter limicola]|uniref:Uncharacterized protein n=1 Tax=Sporosarcina limicola TaxID=34101 RepID=A0A927MM01_9BACL|nr:hypothetical protein [Sporosarcina limicola]